MKKILILISVLLFSQSCSVFENEQFEYCNNFLVVAEQMPVLVGGLAGLQTQIQYPEMARRAGIEGRVTVQFIVNNKGIPEDIRVIRGIGGDADEEAIRVVREHARFEPGMRNSEPVCVQYSLPIVFHLQD